MFSPPSWCESHAMRLCGPGPRYAQTISAIRRAQRCRVASQGGSAAVRWPARRRSTGWKLRRLEPRRYHRISHNPVTIKRLLVDLFVETHARRSRSFSISMPPTIRCMGNRSGGSSTAITTATAICRFTCSAGRQVAARQHRWCGRMEEVARIVAQIRANAHVRILARADCGFAREELMAWCEADGWISIRPGADRSAHRRQLVRQPTSGAPALPLRHARRRLTRRLPWIGAMS
jgi:hypothetical protein